MNARMKKVFLIVLLAATVMQLTACGTSSEEKNLRQYLKEVKNRPARPIEPIPTFEQYKAFDYDAEDLRSPFVPEVAQTPQDPSLLPDTERPKEELEGFPLDALRMVGTLSNAGNTWALIAAPDEAVYRITVGGYMGKNYGKVLKINKDNLQIEETVPDGIGGWKKREVTLKVTP